MTLTQPPSPVSGYVLAGGRSTRMGQEKALLQLAGKPLIQHAVLKLSRLCAEVGILSANSALAQYGTLVPDLHPGCGPLSGIEAALSHASHAWSLILPVDVPFLPAPMLDVWVHTTLTQAVDEGTRLAMYAVDGKPQPALLLIHCDLAAYISQAIARREYKVLPVLQAAAEHLAAARQISPAILFRVTDQPPSLFFANLNTPEDFANAERNLHAL